MEMDSYTPGTPCWIDMGSPDMEASKSFYGALFGWDAVVSPEPEAGGYTQFTLRGRSVAGLGPQMNPGMPPWWTTYIAVADADKTIADVQAAGGSVLMPVMQVMDVGRMAIFTDPAGAVCSVWEAGTHIGCGIVNEHGTLCWNELTVRDAEPAISFYGEVFGWTARTSDTAGGMPYTEFQVDGRAVAGLMRMNEMWPEDIPAHWMVYFAVDDCDAAAAKISELGGSVSVPPTDIDPGRFAVVGDPQGAMFSLLTMKAELLGS